MQTLRYAVLGPTLALIAALVLVACGGAEDASPPVTTVPLDATAPVTPGPADTPMAVTVRAPTQPPVEPTTAPTEVVTATATVTGTLESASPAEDAAGEVSPTAAGTPEEAIGEPAAATREFRSVTFSQPAAGATVPSPVNVCLDARGVTLEPPTGERHADHGHLLVMIDPSPGETQRLGAQQPPPVPEYERYIHLNDGNACTQLELKPGPHLLVGLIVDGSGRPYNPQQRANLRFRVEGE